MKVSLSEHFEYLCEKKYWVLYNAAQGVILLYLGLNKVLQGGNNYSGTKMGHVAQRWTEKKMSRCFRSLLKSFEWTVDCTKKVSSLVTLIASIEFNDLFGMKIYN